MTILTIFLLLLGAQFSFTAFASAKPGKAWLLWPFAEDSRPVASFVGGLPKSRGLLTTVLAGFSGFGFVAAAFGVVGWLVPAAWIVPLALAAAGLSILLHFLWFGKWALLPLLTERGSVSGVPNR